MRLQNRTAIITGAAGSIGSAIARSYAREGADLCLVDREPATDLAEEIRQLGRRVIDVPTDVTSKSAVDGMVAQCLDVFGKVDVVVPVAGVTSVGSAQDLEEAEWDRVLAINLKGVFLCCQAVIASMREHRHGRIITIGSVLGKNGGNPRPWIAPEEQQGAANLAYGAAKAGVHSMTLYLAKELATSGITVNCIAPGPVMSPMTTKLPETLISMIPLGRMGRPEDVAEAATFLASGAADYITGEILDVNGGLWVD